MAGLEDIILIPFFSLRSKVAVLGRALHVTPWSPRSGHRRAGLSLWVQNTHSVTLLQSQAEPSPCLT